MYWKVFKKGVHSPIDKLWFIATMDAQDVHASIEDDYDFPVTISPDKSD